MLADTTRFALLRHSVPQGSPRGDHWDLLLERGGVALTWAIDSLPAVWEPSADDSSVAARRLADHRLLYLDYQGPLSKGRGHVTQEFAGTCQWRDWTPQSVIVQLACPAWTAQVTLIDKGDDEWQLTIVPTAET